MIVIKSENEIALMEEACQIVAETFKIVSEMIKPGMATWEIDKAVYDYITKRGAIPSFKDYNGYPASACISINETVVHGIPGKTKLCEGDIVGIDIGAYYKGFHGDAARTYPVGDVSDEAKKLIEVTRQSFFEGIKFAKEGNRLEDISSAIEQYVVKNGFSVVRNFVGHGIGAKLHEDPNIPNYGTAGRGVRLQNGMCLAIEPMVNIGGHEVYLEEDGWTANTLDGSLSAHYENTIALTKDGPKILTLADDEQKLFAKMS